MSLSDPPVDTRLSESAWEPLKVDALERINDGHSTAAVRSESPFKILCQDDRRGIESEGFRRFPSRREDVEPLAEDPIPGVATDAEAFAAAPEVAADLPPDTEEIERKAYADGYAKGEKEGLDAGMRKAVEVTGRLENILKEMQGIWANLIATYEKEIIRMVGRAAEKVVYGQVAVDHEVVKRTILHAFELVSAPVDVTIEINPEDYEYIDAAKDDFLEQVRSLKNISLLSDPEVSRGGCRIDTRSGIVDGGIETRLDAIRRSLIEVSENRSKV